MPESESEEVKPKEEEKEEEVEDEYACVARSRLTLKDGDGHSSRKRKRKRDKGASSSGPSVTSSKDSHAEPPEPKTRRTPAEIAFQKMQQKMQKERIAQKASMTHKQRVEKFNQHLDSLTEHFDIPKVSWTK